MTILIIIIVIIALPLVGAFFVGNENFIQREVIINKPKQDVFNYLKFLKNQDYYNKWVMRDPKMKKDFRGVDGNVGFVYAWDSTESQTGKGEQEITGITEGERIDNVIRFIKPFTNVSTIHFITTAKGASQTKVVWQFRGQLNYMMKVMHLVLNLKKALGKDMETSLNNLKRILEG